MHPFDHPAVTRLIASALEEDLGRGDVTTAATIPTDCPAEASITAKADLTLAGLPLIERVVQAVDPNARVSLRAGEGRAVQAGTLVAEVWGGAAGLLIAERTVLNFLQHLCGVASLTRRFVEAVAGTACTIIDTVKPCRGFGCWINMP